MGYERHERQDYFCILPKIFFDAIWARQSRGTERIKPSFLILVERNFTARRVESSRKAIADFVIVQPGFACRSVDKKHARKASVT
jgi:hypothetical protein